MTRCGPPFASLTSPATPSARADDLLTRWITWSRSRLAGTSGTNGTLRRSARAATRRKQSPVTGGSDVKSVEELMPMALALARRKSRDDEAEGVALLALVEAHDSWRAGRSLTLESWCRLCVQNALSHWRERESVRSHGELIDGLVVGAAISNLELCQVIEQLPFELRLLATLKWEMKWSDQDARRGLGCGWEEYKERLARARELGRQIVEDSTCVA